MRISDWSSDVCSSDLLGDAAGAQSPPDHRPAVPFVGGRRRARHDGRSAERDRCRMERRGAAGDGVGGTIRSEEHTSELQSLMRISYAVFCLKKKTNKQTEDIDNTAHRSLQDSAN